jgi:hypothetical protein
LPAHFSKIGAVRFAVFNFLAALIWSALILALGYGFGSAIEVFLGEARRIEWKILATLAGLTAAPNSLSTIMGSGDFLMDAQKHLSVDAAAWWSRVARDYSIEDAAGLLLLTVATECLDRLTEAQGAIAAHGLLVEGSHGLRVNPALAVEKDARNGLLPALRQLNLDLQAPADRGRPSSPVGIVHAI